MQIIQSFVVTVLENKFKKGGGLSGQRIFIEYELERKIRIVFKWK